MDIEGLAGLAEGTLLRYLRADGSEAVGPVGFALFVIDLGLVPIERGEDESRLWVHHSRVLGVEPAAPLTVEPEPAAAPARVDRVIEVVAEAAYARVVEAGAIPDLGGWAELDEGMRAPWLAQAQWFAGRFALAQATVPID